MTLFSWVVDGNEYRAFDVTDGPFAVCFAGCTQWEIRLTMNEIYDFSTEEEAITMLMYFEQLFGGL